MPFVKLHREKIGREGRPLDRKALCKGCGAEYDRLWKVQLYCSPQCRMWQPTAKDRSTLALFQNLCKKLHLSAEYTFSMLCHTNRCRYFRLSKQYETSTLGRQTANRYLMVLEKFTRDLQNGYWDLVPHAVRRDMKRVVAVRRINPIPRRCPRGLSHCTGGILAHSCPRQFKECELAG